MLNKFMEQKFDNFDVLCYAAILALAIFIVFDFTTRVMLRRIRWDDELAHDIIPLKEKSLLTNNEAALADVLIDRFAWNRLQADMAALDIVAMLKIEGVLLVSSIREYSSAAGGDGPARWKPYAKEGENIDGPAKPVT